mmetsp:Transcript_77190/g.208539  ORF Transcript_77190/g.208539 Transcript_77190/m.208539 type:complete len:93 (+) Transcript_77190:476-754(+)
MCPHARSLWRRVTLMRSRSKLREGVALAGGTPVAPPRPAWGQRRAALGRWASLSRTEEEEHADTLAAKHSRSALSKHLAESAFSELCGLLRP